MTRIIYTFDQFQFDPEANALTELQSSEQASTQLDPKVAALLEYFLQHPQKVISKSELFEHVWQGSVVTEGSISWCLSQLRKALKDNAFSPHYIKTIPKKGFQFLQPVNTETRKQPSTSSISKISSKTAKLVTMTLILIVFTIVLLVQNTSSVKVGRMALSEVRNITALDGLETDPELSPDQNLLLFRHKANNNGSTFQLYLTKWLNGKSANLAIDLSQDNYQYTSAVWGKTSSEIYATRYQSTDRTCEIVKLRLNYFHTNIEDSIKLKDCHSDGWSRLAYNKNTHSLIYTNKENVNYYSVYKLNLRDGDESRLTNTSVDGLGDHFISQSLDQTKLLILRDTYFSNTEFVLLDLQNNQMQSLLSVPSRYYSAYLSPDNSKIWLNWGNEQLISYDWQNKQSQQLLQSAFGWNYNVKPITADLAMYSVADANAGDLMELHKGEVKKAATNYTEKLPALSPDNTYLAYVSNQTGIPQIWLKSDNFYQPITTDNTFFEYRQLTWSQDSQFLYAARQNELLQYDIKLQSWHLLHEADSAIFYPRVNPSHSKLYFSLLTDGEWYRNELNLSTRLVSKALPVPAWLSQELDDNKILYSQAHKPGLFVFDKKSNTHTYVFDGLFPKNDYWQLQDQFIFFRQTLPNKQLCKTPLTHYSPELVTKLNDQVSELFTMDAQLTRFYFEDRTRNQSDLRSSKINNLNN